MGDLEFEILCAGGEKIIDPNALAGLPNNVMARRIDLTDDDLTCAYSGAEGLVFPSLYEGFGIPVIEAMACGCPVITTKHGALGEISGDAALFISGRDADELRRAMNLIREASHRKRLVESGLQRAMLYDWDATASKFFGLLKKAQEESQKPAAKVFFDRWKQLRRLQAEVDLL
jgi:glycosyltransferase involved in cell wall biosynthesis